jgi:hypothetical protein
VYREDMKEVLGSLSALHAGAITNLQPTKGTPVVEHRRNGLHSRRDEHALRLLSLWSVPLTELARLDLQLSLVEECSPGRPI